MAEQSRGGGGAQAVGDLVGSAPANNATNTTATATAAPARAPAGGGGGGGGGLVNLEKELSCSVCFNFKPTQNCYATIIIFIPIRH